MGNTLASKGLAAHSTRMLSWSKNPKSYCIKLTSRIFSLISFTVGTDRPRQAKVLEGAFEDAEGVAFPRGLQGITAQQIAGREVGDVSG